LVLAYMVLLVVGLIVHAISSPLASLKFVWDILVDAPFGLLTSALAAVLQYLIVIVAIGISVAAAIAAVFLNIYFLSSQFRRLNLRLDKADKQNLLLAFFLMLLPTLLAISTSSRKRRSSPSDPYLPSASAACSVSPAHSFCMKAWWCDGCPIHCAASVWLSWASPV
jgi:hypothetical protein